MVVMAEWDTSILRSELLDRRSRLESARASQVDSVEVERLMRDVDSALQRMDQGTYGICDVCHDTIEKDRLLADPLVCVCIDHLDSGQRRELERDLELALRIQTKLLPERGLRCAGWATHFHYQPAGVVSGDFCDLARQDGGRLFFLVGDVAGKGVAASLLMSHIHATFRTLLSIGAPVGEMMERANHLFCTSTMPSHYATVVCGFASASGEVEVCNAGHCPPLVVRNGGIESIEATGLPLGLFCDGQYSASQVKLEPGETILVYTDGVTEARNHDDDEYGLERLKAVLPRCRKLAPEEMTGECLQDVEAFLAGSQRADDLTLMVIRRLEA
jgi:sigma-B regulation protein RsbU (phosphoserine phosphatase)